jgi:hypothetical protein
MKVTIRERGVAKMWATMPRDDDGDGYDSRTTIATIQEAQMTLNSSLFAWICNPHSLMHLKMR